MSATTAWARAGFGLWRRERGATGSVRAEVAHDGTTILRDFGDILAAQAWCDRWAATLIREAP